MIQYNYFDHVTKEGTKYTDWLQAVRYTYAKVGIGVVQRNNKFMGTQEFTT